MKKTITMALFSACFVPGMAQNLLQNFANPPKDAQPQVWWHWMNGNITEDGLIKDLEWMKRSHIAGAHVFDAGLYTPQIVEKRLEYMTPEWKKAFKTAVNKADELGIDLSIATAPGWSYTGGPWVQPKDAMKKLSWSELHVQGGSKKAVKYALPAPMTAVGFFQNANAVSLADQIGGVDNGKIPNYYEDIAIIAVRKAAADKTLQQLGAKLTCSGGNMTIEQLTDGDYQTKGLLLNNPTGEYSWIQYEFPTAQTFKSLSLASGRTRSEWEMTDAPEVISLWASNDGQHFSKVCMIPDGKVAQQTMDIPATTARYFRLQVPNAHASQSDLAALFVGGDMPKPAGNEIADFRLYSVPKINHFEEKTGWVASWDLAKYPTPDALDSEVIQKTDIIDLTSLVDAQGNFSYQFPAGDWIVYRIGNSLTGKQNHPASPEATGLEVDKMDPEAWHTYFKTYLDMYKDASGGLMGQRGIQYLMLDSYEAGSMTWTPRMLEQFQKRRGYSMIPWMPVLLGHIVGSTQESEAFLWDFRTTCGELIAEGYDAVGEIAKKEYSMKGRFTEAHENGRLYMVDGMDVKRKADIPMSAIWVPTAGSGSTLEMSISDIRESAAVAHIFGQNYVAAESMTCVGFNNQGWSFHPGNLKWLVDTEFANGLNRLVVHESAHQPLDDKKPGLGLLIFGQWFNRHETWAPYASYWMDYVARSSYMLQQGRFVADILYYYGEEHNITGLFGRALPDIPRGYEFDFCNPTALLQEVSAQNQQLVTRSGMKYNVLVLDKNCEKMSLPVLRKLAQLAEQGITIIGQEPQMPASLTDNAEEWHQLVKQIWHSGRANVSTTQTMLQALQGKGIQPDFSYAKAEHLNLPYVHRSTPTQEIYWVKNPTDQALKVTATFRVTGKKPMIYHPETGTTEECSYTISEGNTQVTLNLVSEDAVFVVFEGTPAQNQVILPEKDIQTLFTMHTPWTVQFQENLGAPAQIKLEKLQDLSTHTDKGVKYYSGMATYKNTFRLDKADVASGKQLCIDLGKVAVMAEVLVNGQSVGLAWKAPYTLDITQAVKAGENTLEIRVTNTWQNRLIGDCQPDEQVKYTFSTMPFYNQASPLPASGLMGPVKIMAQ